MGNYNEKWQPYPNKRKIFKKQKYCVIVPEDYNATSIKIMPLFCPVCDFRFSSVQDESAYKKFECCNFCADTWAYANSEQWKKGWRPSTEQLKNSMQRRSVINRHIRFE